MTALLRLLLGMVLGAAIAYTRCYAIDAENARLRASLSQVRSMALLGSGPLRIKREVDRALAEEAA